MGEQGRLLIVAAHFPPMGGGGVTRIFNFAKYLARMGWDVTALVPEPSAAAAHERASLDERLAEELRAVGVRTVATRLPLDPPPPPTLVRSGRVVRILAKPVQVALNLAWPLVQRRSRRTLPDQYGFWADEAERAARELLCEGMRVDVVLGTSPPHSTQVAAMRVAHVFGAPLVTDFRDQWVGNPHPLVSGGTPAQQRANSALERKVLRVACAIVTPTEESAEHFAAKHGEALRPKLRVIPNGYDGDTWRGAISQRETAAGGGGSGKLTISYVGTLYPPRDPTPFARAFISLAQRRPSVAEDVRLRVVGPLERSYAETLRETLGESFEEAGAVSMERSLDEMLASDWLLVLLHAGEGASTAVPAKIYEYMAARRPVLALVSQGAASRVVSENSLGLIADPDDVDRIAVALERIYDDWRSGDCAFEHALPDESAIAAYDRAHEAAELAAVLVDCKRNNAERDA